MTKMWWKQAVKTLCEKVCLRNTCDKLGLIVTDRVSRTVPCTWTSDSEGAVTQCWESCRRDTTRSAEDAERRRRRGLVLATGQCRFSGKLIGPVLRWFRSYLVGRSQHARSRLNYIHSCPCDLQRHCACISAVMFQTSCRHDVKTTVAVLCVPSSGSTVNSSFYCRQATLPSFRRQHTTTFHRTSLVLQCVHKNGPPFYFSNNFVKN